MSIEFPRSGFVALQDQATRLYDSRKAGTGLPLVARDLLIGLFDVCAHTGLDRVMVELAEAHAPLDPADRAGLASQDSAVEAVVAQLKTIDLDGGGPRGAKPRQLAECVVAALGLTLVDDAERTITLDDAVRAEVTRAITAVLDTELAAPKMRADIIANARARIEAGHHTSFDRIAAQLDERGLQLIKQPKVPIDALHAVQRVLLEGRNAVISRIADHAFSGAHDVLARVSPEAAARIDQPISLRATPREVAALRAIDARVPKTPTHILHSLFGSLTELLRLSWRAAEQTAVPYAASKTFAVGDVIDHPKFGRGKVTASVLKRIDVEFAEGTYTLVHAPPAK